MYELYYEYIYMYVSICTHVPVFSACMGLYVFLQFHGVFYRINFKIEKSSLLLKTHSFILYIYVHLLLGVCGCESVRVSDLAPYGSWGLNLDCQAW